MTSKDLNFNCPECGYGPMLPRQSGFYYCPECGKLEVRALGAPLQPSVADEAAEFLAKADEPLPQTIQVPDLSECIIGWRAWCLEQNPRPGHLPLLRSVTQRNEFWHPGVEIEAVCLKDRSGKQHTKRDGTPMDLPVESCSCGLYAANSLEHLMSMSYHTHAAEREGMYHVVGEVAQWGKVIVGSQGWRAQYAYPSTLYLPYEAWRLAEPLAEAYSVPVRLKNTLDYDAAESEW